MTTTRHVYMLATAAVLLAGAAGAEEWTRARIARLRGVELMSYTGGVTSAAHDERDAADTAAAFDDLVGELAGDVLVRA